MIIKYTPSELRAEGKWFYPIKDGDVDIFKKYLKERDEGFFITSDENKERHLKGKIYMDEYPIYPTCRDEIIEGLAPDSRLEFILIILNDNDTHNNLDILYALLHNYHLICKGLSPKIIEALKPGLTSIKKFSCFLVISEKWNGILYKLSLVFNVNLDSLFVNKNDWKQYSQWDGFIPMPNPQKSIEKFLKPYLTQKPKEVEVNIIDHPEQGALFENRIKEIEPPELNIFNPVIEYINSSYPGGYLEMTEAIKLNNVMIWVYKDNYRYVVISNTFQTIIWPYADNPHPLSPKDLAVQVYTFGAEYHQQKKWGRSSYESWILASLEY